MKIAIVGGGWAGLSAAVTALDYGYEVHLHESAARLGGRARSIDGKALHTEATDIDNGQHILLGAYSATLELMRRLGLDPEARFQRLPLNVRSADGTLMLDCRSTLPAPLHIAAGLVRAKGLTLREKHAAIRIMLQLKRKRWLTPPGATVQEWLHEQRQPARLQTLLWHPLCIATLNTPADRACAQLFATVLRDSLGAGVRAASDMLIPRHTLSELWPDSVLALASNDSGEGCAHPKLRIHSSSTVKQISYARRDNTGPIKLDEHPHEYDAVIVTCNTPSAARLLATLPPVHGSAQLIADLQAFEHAPIATLTLQLAQHWALPAPMLMLHEDRPRGHFGQWLFQGQNADENLVHIVISDAAALASRPRETVVSSIVEQLGEQVRNVPMPARRAHALIVEKRATFLAVPGLTRPGHETPWPGIWLAGDWTDTGYPAVLEGAVRSGRAAVQCLVAAVSEF